MNSLLKWGLIGGGALLLFHDQIAAALGISPPGSTPAAANAATPAAASSAAGITPTSAADTRALMLAAVQNDAIYQSGAGRMSAYQWGFYYRIVRGIDAPAPEALGLTDGATLLSLDEYWTLATRAGLSGIRRRPMRRF